MERVIRSTPGFDQFQGYINATTVQLHVCSEKGLLGRHIDDPNATHMHERGYIYFHSILGDAELVLGYTSKDDSLCKEDLATQEPVMRIAVRCAQR